MNRSARDVVQTYNFVVWNQRNFDLAYELFADAVIRHDVGEVQTLTREQAVQRIRDVWAMFADMRFKLPVVVAGDDGEHVAILFDTEMTTADGTAVQSASMEIFRVLDGRIAEVWNCGRKDGRWA